MFKSIKFTAKALFIVACIYAYLPDAHAKAQVVDGGNKTIYFDESGKRLTPLQANKLGEEEKTVYACKVQDYECNERTGKCALKNARWSMDTIKIIQIIALPHDVVGGTRYEVIGLADDGSIWRMDNIGTWLRISGGIKWNVSLLTN